MYRCPDVGWHSVPVAQFVNTKFPFLKCPFAIFRGVLSIAGRFGQPAHLRIAKAPLEGCPTWQRNLLVHREAAWGQTETTAVRQGAPLTGCNTTPLARRLADREDSSLPVPFSRPVPVVGAAVVWPTRLSDQVVSRMTRVAVASSWLPVCLGARCRAPTWRPFWLTSWSIQ